MSAVGIPRLQAWEEVNSRYLHKLFDAESETLARYIRRRRLEECARIFANPLQSARSISWVAFEYGFSNIAHFSKSFREQYGRSPSEYRQSAAAGNTAVRSAPSCQSRHGRYESVRS